MSDILLLDSCVGSGLFLDLNESSSNGRTRFRGKFQEANAINKNKRMYTYETLDENVKRLQEVITEGGLIGELDHPTDSIIHFANASHIIKKLWWDVVMSCFSACAGKVPQGDGGRRSDFFHVNR